MVAVLQMLQLSLSWHSSNLFQESAAPLAVL
jgi:hypothetical protein